MDRVRLTKKYRFCTLAMVPTSKMMAHDTEHQQEQEKRLKAICGANVEDLENCHGLSIPEIRRRMASVLNITDEHTITILNGREITRPEEYLLNGTEELEFKRVAGRKG